MTSLSAVAYSNHHHRVQCLRSVRIRRCCYWCRGSSLPIRLHRRLQLCRQNETMNVLTLYVEPSLNHVIQSVLEAEVYRVIAVRQAAEAVQTLDAQNDSCFLVLVDNFQVSTEARTLLTTLRDVNQSIRRRIRIIGISAASGPSAPQSITNEFMDDFLPMPFTSDQLLSCIARNAANFTE